MPTFLGCGLKDQGCVNWRGERVVGSAERKLCVSLVMGKVGHTLSHVFRGSARLGDSCK